MNIQSQLESKVKEGFLALFETVLPTVEFQATRKDFEGAKYPKHAHMIVYGEDLRTSKKLNSLNLSWLIKAKKQNRTKNFFNSFFTKLAGTEQLQKQLEEKISEEKIKASWQEGLDAFKKVRSKYLIYK